MGYGAGAVDGRPRGTDRIMHLKKDMSSRKGGGRARAATITVDDSGTYFDNVNVNKQLTLRGIGQPVVDARGIGSAITLAADGIALEGFTAILSGGTNYADR